MPELYSALAVGDAILIDDGSYLFNVTAVTPDSFTAKSADDYEIPDRKGMNMKLVKTLTAIAFAAALMIGPAVAQGIVPNEKQIAAQETLRKNINETLKMLHSDKWNNVGQASRLSNHP